MKYLSKILLLVLLPVFFGWASIHSKQQIFLNMVDVNGQLIRGTSLQRGFEKQIIVTAFSGVTTGNSLVKFSMPSGAASAAFATMQGRKETLPYAVFSITEPTEAKPHVLSTVRLESFRILTVEDANGSTHITIRAARIGTTYFQYDRKTGVRSISGKTGYDYTTGQLWNSF